MTAFAVGSLVRARGREWVVLPESEDDLLVLRPLGGSEDEVAGVLTDVEAVEPASFALPSPDDIGDYRSARLLRDALRLGFRSSAGPFRSFGRIAVEPRPYQLVPLLMALRLDPVRLLIADDVGIGKTVEALLVAEELLEQGDARRLCVLCPPHLAEQWRKEMASKFHLDATLVLPSTAGSLERSVRRGVGESIFERLDVTIVSTDFIKSPARRDDFLRAAPDLVIVDEAHTCVADLSERGRTAAHQRHELIAGLAQRPERHLLLVTATPHSGKEGAFRALLELLDPSFRDLPENLAGEANRPQRERLARHLVQRLRGDVNDYPGPNTAFPKRVSSERTYRLSPAYGDLFADVLAYARETVTDASGGLRRQRVRWWSALALLRSLASSPAAAKATLLVRSAPGEAETVDEADEVGRRTVMDLADDDAEEPTDVVPGADPTEYSDEGTARAEDKAAKRRLRAFAERAAALAGSEDDTKLVELVRLVRRLLEEGHSPIVFCRFIPTANYVAEQLRSRLAVKGVTVSPVTGELPGEERETQVAELIACSPRVLVATDCLSEGINLQGGFDAVVHYDLAWNPTRHEQREGRVDRFGQPREEVRVVTLWGEDNGIDKLVIDVLVRKHQAIRSSLGVSVPVPGAQAVAEALVGGLLLRGGPEHEQLSLDLLPHDTQLILEGWEEAAREEKRNRGLFGQHGLDVSEVAAEMAAVRSAVGAGADVERFVQVAVNAAGGTVVAESEGRVRLSLTAVASGLRDAVGRRSDFIARFDLPVPEGVEYLSRTHPFVEGLAVWTLESALDPARRSIAARTGATRTNAVATRTTILLVRRRYDIELTRGGQRHRLLAEDATVHAFSGDPIDPSWMSDSEAEALLAAAPGGNVSAEQARELVGRALAAQASWRPHLEARAVNAADELALTHRRVREGGRQSGARTAVRAQPPVDVLGLYVLLPVPSVR
jgi:superfamily II DNA or RNA helicase